MPLCVALDEVWFDLFDDSFKDSLVEMGADIRSGGVRVIIEMEPEETFWFGHIATSNDRFHETIDGSVARRVLKGIRTDESRFAFSYMVRAKAVPRGDAQE